MVTARGGMLVAVMLGVACWAGVARADDDEALRKRALALNTVTGEDPIKGEIKALVDDPARTRKLLQAALPLAKEKDQPFSYNAAFILARAAQELKELDASRTFYRICITQAVKLVSGKKLAESYEGLINLLTQHKKLDEIVQVSQEFLELPAEGANMSPVRRMQSGVLLRMISVLARQGQTEKAMKLVDRLVEAQPDNWLVLDIKGRVQREAGQNEEAAKTYQDVLDQIKKDQRLTKEEKTELSQEYRHILSGIYVDMNQVNKAAEVLKSLLAENPDHPTYNNDLGYIWADHDMNLEESEKLIRKAIEEDRKQRKGRKGEEGGLKPDEDKDNAAYLDSLGWVLYKQKKYKEALKYLELAVKDEDGQHLEILDHLADVHLALGQKDKAIAIWKKALELESAGKREQLKRQEVEKKLKANQ